MIYENIKLISKVGGLRFDRKGGGFYIQNAKN